MADRPEWIKCIAYPIATKSQTWCGRELHSEFAFTGLDHVAANAITEGRLWPCPECMEAAEELLHRAFMVPEG
jgi:hypothetical protein